MRVELFQPELLVALDKSQDFGCLTGIELDDDACVPQSASPSVPRPDE
jgi:hypothetical protein